MTSDSNEKEQHRRKHRVKEKTKKHGQIKDEQPSARNSLFLQIGQICLFQNATIIISAVSVNALYVSSAEFPDWDIVGDVGGVTTSRPHHG